MSLIPSQHMAWHMCLLKHMDHHMHEYMLNFLFIQVNKYMKPFSILFSWK